MPLSQIVSTRNGVSSVTGYRDDLVAGDLVGLTLTNYVGITSVLWELIGRPEGSAAGGAGPEPIFLATANSASFNADSDAGDFRLDGTYTVQATLNPGSPGQVRITTVLCRLSGLTIPGPSSTIRVLRKLGGFEALEDTSVPTILLGWATELNRWLELVRELALSGSSSTTLQQAYAHGASGSDQTMVLHDAKGGGIIVDATQGDFTGASAFRINTVAGGPVVVDRATGRLGIGIAAPLQAVHTKGSAPALRLDRTGGVAFDVANVGDELQFLNGATVLGKFLSTGGLRADLGVGIGTAPATAAALALGAASTVAVSSAGTARFRYNEVTGHAEWSENGGAYQPFSAAFSAYSTIEGGGSAVTARNTLNFSAAFTVADNGGATRTDVDLANVGPGAGTIGGSGIASITLNAKGQVTAAATATYATVAGLFYQQAQAAGTNVTQRPIVNFGTGLSAVDNGGATRTDVTANVDGTSIVLGGGAIERGILTGDVTASAGSTTTTIAGHAVTYAKIQAVSALSVLGNPTGSTANVSEITATTNGQALQMAAGGLIWAALPYSALSGAPTIFYQTVDALGGPLNQRPAINFGNPPATGLAATDNVGANRTDIVNTLVTGLSGGQAIFGGTGAAENLTLAANIVGTGGGGHIQLGDANSFIRTVTGSFGTQLTLQNFATLYGGTVSTNSGAGLNIGSAGGPPLNSPIFVNAPGNALKTIWIQNTSAGASAIAAFQVSTINGGPLSIFGMYGTGTGFSQQTVLLATDNGIGAVMNVIIQSSSSAGGGIFLNTNGTERLQVMYTGEVRFVEMAAPSAPSATHVSTWVDSTAHNLWAIGSSGAKSHTVKTQAATTHQFLTAIDDDGTVHAAQPAYADISGTPTIFYQTVAAAGSALTQRPTLNFAARFAAVDNGGATRSDVDLANSGVTAGTYSFATVTVDAFGRVTSASSGTGGGTVVSVGTTLPIVNTGSGSAPVIALNYDNASITLNGSNQIQVAAFTGDVTRAAGGTATTLANIPNDVVMAGDLLATAIAAPVAPAAGKVRIYVDSTSLNLAAKTNGGVINHGVQTAAPIGHQWINAIAADGTVSLSQPAYSDISGTPTIFYQTIQQAGSGLTQRAAWNASTGLTATDNSGAARTEITVNLSAGVPGGQAAVGGTNASDSLTLSSTTSGTKGKVLNGSWFALDEANQRLGVGTTSPIATMQVALTDDTNPSVIVAWDGRHVALGSAGATGPGIGFSHSTGTSTGNISFVHPNTAWENAALRALTFSLYSNGTVLGLSQNSGGNVAIASLAAGGIVKAAVTSGQLQLAVAGTDYLAQAYTTIAQSGSTRTARSELNFGSAFLVADNVTFTRTDVDLQPGAVDLGDTYPFSTVVAIHETGGPTQLTFGAIPDSNPQPSLLVRPAGTSTIVGLPVSTAVPRAKTLSYYETGLAPSNSVGGWLATSDSTSFHSSFINYFLNVVPTGYELTWNVLTNTITTFLGLENVTLQVYKNNVLQSTSLSILAGAGATGQQTTGVVTPFGPQLASDVWSVRMIGTGTVTGGMIESTAVLAVYY